MGSRRTHEEAAVAAARAAYIAGFAATSNLEAGRRYGIPTTGTSAHAFTLLHDTERDAFAAQVASLGTGTTLLVDTYDVTDGRPDRGRGGRPRARRGPPRLRRPGRARRRRCGRSSTSSAPPRPGSWSPATSTSTPSPRWPRRRSTRYGVGTSLVTGSGAPTAGFVYKLVERDGVPVEKTSARKSSRGGHKHVSRRLESGTAVADIVRIASGAGDAAPGERPLHIPLVRSGGRVDDGSLAAARERKTRSLHELPRAALQMSRGEPALDVLFV